MNKKKMNKKITGNASVQQCEFTVDVKLTLGEAEALKEMASYNTRDFLDALYAKLGKSYIQPHEEDLKSLFSTIKQTLPAEIKKLNEVKEKIEKALS